MKIIYITNAMLEEDYNSFVNKAKTIINPSNQNFHLKLIKALEPYNKVDVISVRPLSKNCKNSSTLPKMTKHYGNAVFHYIPICKNRLKKKYIIKREIKKLTNSLNKEEAIIVSDTNNLNLSKNAIKMAKKWQLKSVGVLTDNPYLFTNVKKSFARKIVKIMSKFDMYLSITSPLTSLPHNLKQKPSFIFEGLIEDIKATNKPHYNNYFFFGGAIYRRYGVLNLIRAFMEIKNSDISLLMAGHGQNIIDVKEATKVDSRIKYLGLLSQREIYELESNSLANINPRLFNKELDDYSVPSKLIEYLSFATPIISGYHTELMNLFSNEIHWCDSGVESLKQEMLKILNNIPKYQNLASIAKNKALKLFSLSNIGEKITHFINANK